MIKKKINELRKKFNFFGIDGYIIPKNDEYFGEYAQNDRLKKISNFSGSAGCAIILKKKNYLFVDGRYTIQAGIEAGKYFKIISYEKIINCKILKNLKLGIDPKIFTSSKIKNCFNKNNEIKNIDQNLIDLVFKKNTPKPKSFYSIDKSITGQSHLIKIKRVISHMKKNKSKYLFISAPENVAWLLNIRGYDNPTSPIPNCRLLLNDKKKIFLIAEEKKVKKLIKEKKILKQQIIEPKNFEYFIKKIKKGKIIIDKNSCSIYHENLIKRNLEIKSNEDPIYFLKSLKTPNEINSMIEAHVLDGVALTKFLYWIKNVNKRKISEFDAQNKLEFFRKKNKKYLYPSFNTIAGSGKNGAIVHYRANKKSAKKIDKKDIFLCDSGGQYKYGTTDVTRTICFSKPKQKIKNVFTKVLKGHIAVISADLKKNFNGKLIDVLARKSLIKSGLNYKHGTGHGVGFFLNVHEGPHAISKFNTIKICEGMIVSNEPGYYKKGEFGIRIENLIYVKKDNNQLTFENLTLAPIEKDLINYEMLDDKEKNYLFIYHLTVYSRLSKFLNSKERKWLASFI